MQPAAVILRPAVASIDEERCIGCTLCIEACPVDAIVGAAKLMHTVIANACTGCELCMPPCPVDCISMLPSPLPDAAAWNAAEDAARRRVEARNARLLRDEKTTAAAARREASAGRRKRETIAKVLARAKARLDRR
jgi:electron transport complex protein RnfB